MKQAPIILIVDDDEGHAILIRQNLETAGLGNRIAHFRDGQEVLDFLFLRDANRARLHGETYLLLLDIRMPKVDGIEVLRQLKGDPELRKMPVIMLTTDDDARAVERCHRLGCSAYIQKPVDYDRFTVAIQQLGLFVNLLLAPPLNGPAH